MEAFINYPITEVVISYNNISLYQSIAGQIQLSIPQIHEDKQLLIENNWQVQAESLYRTILNMQENFVSRKHSIYFPQQYTLFFQIQFANFLGQVPYSSTSTVEIVQTQSLAFTLQIGFLIIGVENHGSYQLSVFQPAGTPQPLIPLMVLQEIVAYQFRTISLGLRQAINQITGHVQTKVCVSFIYGGALEGTNPQVLQIPISLQSQFLSQEVQIAYQQAYIFIFITCQTIKDQV